MSRHTVAAAVRGYLVDPTVVWAPWLTWTNRPPLATYTSGAPCSPFSSTLPTGHPSEYALSTNGQRRWHDPGVSELALARRARTVSIDPRFDVPVVVPAGGQWIKYTDLSTGIVRTRIVSAGTYYFAETGGATDLMMWVAAALTPAAATEIHLAPTGRVFIDSAAPLQIHWTDPATTFDGAVLGFDTSADTTLVADTQTCSQGWRADGASIPSAVLGSAADLWWAGDVTADQVASECVSITGLHEHTYQITVTLRREAWPVQTATEGRHSQPATDLAKLLEYARLAILQKPTLGGAVACAAPDGRAEIEMGGVEEWNGQLCHVGTLRFDVVERELLTLTWM